MNMHKDKYRIVAGLLGLFLGAFGAHNFYLGNKSVGKAQLIVTIGTLGVGGLWGIIDGITVLCGRVKTDADGMPLL
ncbi:MAG: TM2 domain-containing protein [Lachnospiraceae bacterium]|nr:TM2 domain-containing protein [Lachnospiraceae bacterium]